MELLKNHLVGLLRSSWELNNTNHCKAGLLSSFKKRFWLAKKSVGLSLIQASLWEWAAVKRQGESNPF
jgi:hypothetical protein